MESKQFTQFGSVGSVFMDSQLKILSELFIELLIVFSIFSNLVKHFKRFLDDAFLDDFQDPVLLEIFSRNVKRKIFTIYYSLNEAQVFRDQFFTIIHNEYSSDIKFYVILLLLGLEQVEGSSLGDKQNSLEFKLAFY